MWHGHDVVDTDGHIMEPLWLWADYLEPAFRRNRLRVERDEADGDKLLINDTQSRLIRRLGGVRAGGEIRDWNHLPADGRFASYVDSVTEASWDGAARLKWLDDNGIAATLLFPSLGLIWPRETDPVAPYALAHFDAYNRWIADMTSVDPTRLIPVGQVPLTADAGLRLLSLVEQGFRHIMIPGGFGSSLVEADPLFAAAHDAGVTIHLHKVAIPHFLPAPSATSLSTPAMPGFFNHVNEILPGQLFLTALVGSGALDRYPALRFAFHECNAGWLRAWADRAGESWETLRGNHADGLPAAPPRAYLTERDTLFFSIGLGEDLMDIPDWLWPRLMLATDYPHPGTPDDPAAAWSSVLAELPAGHATGLLSANAIRMGATVQEGDHGAFAR